MTYLIQPTVISGVTQVISWWNAAMSWSGKTEPKLLKRKKKGKHFFPLSNSLSYNKEGLSTAEKEANELPLVSQH